MTESCFVRLFIGQDKISARPNLQKIVASKYGEKDRQDHGRGSFHDRNLERGMGHGLHHMFHDRNSYWNASRFSLHTSTAVELNVVCSTAVF